MNKIPRKPKIGIKIVKGSKEPFKPHTINSEAHKRFVKTMRELMQGIN